MRNILKKYPILREMFLYGIIGVISSGLDAAAFFILTHLGLNTYLSNFISINLGICCSFILNSFITFRMTDKIAKRMLKFFGVGYCGLVLSTIIIYLGVDVLGEKEIIVKLISIVIVAAFQFVLNKLVTFKGEKHNG